MSLAAVTSTSTPPPPVAAGPVDGRAELAVSPFQGRLLELPEDLCLALTGGRGGGKGRGAALLVLRHVAAHGRDAAVLWIRRSHPGVRDAEQQLLEVFGAAFGPKGFRFNSNAGLFRFPSGATLELNQLSAVADYQKYQGRSFTMLVVDEVTQWPSPALLDKMRSNVRGPAGVPTRIIVAGNPGDVGHSHVAARWALREPWKPYAEDWLQGEAAGPGPARRWLTAPSCYLDNPFIDPAAYRRELAASCAEDPELLSAWLDGDWSVVRGAYFADVLSDANALPDYPFDLFEPHRKHGYVNYSHGEHFVRIHGGVSFDMCLDFGSSAPSVCYFLARSGGLEIDGRFYRPGSILALDEVALASDVDPTVGLGYTVPEQASEFLAMAKRWGISHPHTTADDACFASHGHQVGSIADEFKSSKLPLTPANKGGRVAGWQKMRTLLKGAQTPDLPGLFVARRCSYFWKTVPYLMRSPKRREDVDTNGPDHGADSLRYGCTKESRRGYVLPLR